MRIPIPRISKLICTEKHQHKHINETKKSLHRFTYGHKISTQKKNYKSRKQTDDDNDDTKYQNIINNHKPKNKKLKTKKFSFKRTDITCH